MLGETLAHPQIRALADSLRERPGTVTSPAGIGAWAAVAVIVRARGDDAEVLFIKRVEREGDHWSGQSAFPGGREDESDGTLDRTAVRETWEEIGVDLSAIAEPLGTLDDIAPRSPVLPPIAVRPFVFAAPGAVEATAGHEVAEVFWIPFDVLLDPSAHVQTEVQIREGPRRVDAVLHSGHVIWGMTYRIVTQIVERLS